MEVGAALALQSLKDGRLNPTWPPRLAEPASARCSPQPERWWGGTCQCATFPSSCDGFRVGEEIRVCWHVNVTLLRAFLFYRCGWKVAAVSAGTESASSSKCHHSRHQRGLNSRLFLQLVFPHLHILKAAEPHT